MEVNPYIAHIFSFSEAFQAWRLAVDLNRFVWNLPPHAKALVNPKMKFRVLATMDQMRWKKRKPYRQRVNPSRGDA